MKETSIESIDRERNPDRRKIKLFHLSEDMLLDLIFNGGDFKIVHKFPKNSIIRNIDFDPDRLGFRIIIQSTDFDVVREGETMPIIHGAIELVERKEYFERMTKKLIR